MTTAWLHVVCVFALLGAGSVLSADPTLLYLVGGRVRSVSDEGLRGTAKIEVTIVYSGPDKLVGESFEDVYHSYGADRRGEAILRKVEVGEEGLWVLWRAKDGLRVGSPPEGSGWPIGRRSLKEYPFHKAHKGIAEAVKEVEQEKPEKRFALLQKFARDEARFTTYWAMCAIGQLDTADARKYLDELAARPDPTLPVAAQLAFDDIMCRRAEGDWPDSKPRVAMLRAWVTGKAKAEAASGVLSRLYQAHQNHHLADKLAVELHRKAGENTEWPVEMRGEAIRKTQFTFSFSASDEARMAVVEWVFEQMRSNESIELRRTAAGTLSQLPLYAARVKVIEEHLATEKDEKVAASLRAAIKKAKEMK